MEAAEALDKLESLILRQREASPMLSMEWRAHTADLMHLNDVRREL